MDKLMEDGEIENYEVDLLTVNKSIKTCLITASIEVDSENNNYIQGIIHDVTSLKKAELASLQAEKLAATSRFIRTMAHEVRNPLNNINLSTENLVQQISNEDDRLYLEIIERNAKRINDLITELLQSSRPADIELHSISLLAIVDDVITSVQDRAVLRKITIHFDHTGGDCMIKADKTKLEMALLNILINAIEAVADETGKIEIIVHCKPTQAVLIISDNGVWNEPGNKSKII
jgi:signal transduction histidine kinase